MKQTMESVIFSSFFRKVVKNEKSGADALTKQYPNGKLFEGADGCRYFAIKTGRFVE